MGYAFMLTKREDTLSTEVQPLAYNSALTVLTSDTCFSRRRVKLQVDTFRHLNCQSQKKGTQRAEPQELF
ncbi:hypothetical protein Q8A67_021295 [Cirrhinus molitorella]|uniref:Uncharacterized protein n=1 Tax=Cirrhinus molitorella TaxID=172907 RepID=A0AA88P9N7_9TELE|nr:hypothetical protein Q8A67_021295 [Cirrhinus molitorella]